MPETFYAVYFDRKEPIALFESGAMAESFALSLGTCSVVVQAELWEKCNAIPRKQRDRAMQDLPPASGYRRDPKHEAAVRAVHGLRK